MSESRCGRRRGQKAGRVRSGQTGKAWWRWDDIPNHSWKSLKTLSNSGVSGVSKIRGIPQRGCTEGQQAHKKTLNIISPWGNANQNYSDTAFAPAQMAGSEKTDNNKCWGGSGEIGTLVRCWRDCRTVRPISKTVWHFPKMLNIELPYDSVIPRLCIYQGK